jgi:MoaA/NifB/PqqE/SkfB family radical SAM enzyme
LTEERARSLKQSGLFGVAVSLDHFDPEIHDERRGRKGAFQTACRAVRISRRHGFYTMLQLVATKDMADDRMFDEYLRRAQGLGVHEIRLLEPMPTGRLLKDSDGCRLTNEERRKLFLLHRRTNRPGKTPKVCSFAYIEDGSMYGCGAGMQHMYIDAQGNVCPCDFVPISFGNVKDEELTAVWNRMRAAFSKPRRQCFLMCNSHKLREAFEGNLPIPHEEVQKTCDFVHNGEVPDYYKALGWT